jgi:molybdate/tungstate transport system substrate-binding protein
VIDHNPALADWLVKFASAEIVVAYTPNSMFFNDLEKTSKDQHPRCEVLSYDGFKLRTDAEPDPIRFYAIVHPKLANPYHTDQKIKEGNLYDDRNTDQIFPEERRKSALETNRIYLAASYKHETVARGLLSTTLPEEISFSNFIFSNSYRQVSYILRRGQPIYDEPILFSHTILRTSINIDRTIAFIKFLLSYEGQCQVKHVVLNPIKAITGQDFEKIPSTLESVVGDQK